MYNSSSQYSIVVRPKGKSQADEYYHNGATWIEGREGNTYTIDITNSTYQRALFIVSVDGLDVLKGKVAGPDSEGYVLNPYQTISIPGWKLNNREAAQFFFSRDEQSYVTSLGGDVSNTGVIGAMVFREQSPIYNQYHMLAGTPFIGTCTGQPLFNGMPSTISGIGGSLRGVSSNASSPLNNAGVNNVILTSATPSPVSQDVGTGFGEVTEWKTTNVSFTKADPANPDAILAIYYNTARNLEKMGIRLRRRHSTPGSANPFPAYTQSGGCTPPADWKRRR